MEGILTLMDHQSSILIGAPLADPVRTGLSGLPPQARYWRNRYFWGVLALIALLLFLAFGLSGKAEATSIPVIATPCTGCTTQAQIDAAALTYFQTWLEKSPAGYNGALVNPPQTPTNGCGTGTVGATDVLVYSTTSIITSTYYGCYESAPRGGDKIVAINIPTTAVDVQAAPSMPFQGNTNATVNSQFPVVMDWEFETYPAAQLNAQLAVMGDIELARFSQMYYVATGGNTATLLMYAAQKLTAANLVRFASAFGAAATGTAVNLYAPAAVQSTYATTPARALIKESHAQHASVGAVSMTVNGLASGVAAPTVWMTPYEIYTEFIFTSAETELGALALTLRYMTVELTTAWGIGWKAGSAYYAFGESMDPDFAINLPLIYADAEANEFGPIDGSTVVPDGTAWIDDPSFYDFNDTTFTQAQ